MIRKFYLKIALHRLMHLRQEVDLATLGELTQEKYGVLDASVYVFQDNINILIPYPTLGVAGTSALIGIFSNPVIVH